VEIAGVLTLRSFVASGAPQDDDLLDCCMTRPGLKARHYRKKKAPEDSEAIFFGQFV